MPDTQPHTGILEMTLGQILNTNPTAQNLIMEAMNINQDQFRQLLESANNNQMMNMTIRDLFQNGSIAKAIATTQTPATKPILIQKIKKLFS
jgi:hypothetical protein